MTKEYKGIGNYIVKGSIINIDDEASELEKEEQRQTNRKAVGARHLADMELESKFAYQKANVCPYCHFVLPTSGKCDCGYDKHTSINPQPANKLKRQLRILHI